MRYTLLKHETYDDFHLDFLLDIGTERLLTMQIFPRQATQTAVSFEKFTNFLLSQNVTNDIFCVAATRIFDHRKIYLDFEGEIDGNKGHVTQLDTGYWEMIAVYSIKINLRTNSTKHAQVSHYWQLLFPTIINIADLSRQNLMNILPAPSKAVWQINIS